MKCPNCNAEIAEGSAHCTSCGTALASAAEPIEVASEAYETAESAAPAPVEAPAAPEPEKKESFLKSLFSGKDEPAETPAASEASSGEKPQHEKKEPSLEQLTKPAGVFRFLGMLFVLTVPVLNVVMLFKWGFGWGVNKNVRNYSRAMLLYILLMMALFITLWIIWPEGLRSIGNFISKLAAFKFFASK